ncbi:MAG TPA: hypothetical protein VMT33_06615 [Candidatus Bathyarchaeia archaeon]|nr:hypothetical protein [Candidatus Bathyarchaeia archaeon]
MKIGTLALAAMAVGAVILYGVDKTGGGPGVFLSVFVLGFVVSRVADTRPGWALLVTLFPIAEFVIQMFWTGQTMQQAWAERWTATQLAMAAAGVGALIASQIPRSRSRAAEPA